MRVFSFGGGVQSTAVLVIAAAKVIHYDAFLFANVGDDSENPDTLSYIREVALPFAKRYGLRIEMVRRTRRDGTHQTLLERIHQDSRSVPIPLRLAPVGAPGRRSCTQDFKMKPIADWLKAHGATDDAPATLGIGISTDEFQRARTTSKFSNQLLEYPLLNLRVDRAKCLRLITIAGLPHPPKSACWFCPYHRVGDWQRIRQEHPERFADAVAVEKLLSERRQSWGKTACFLSTRMQPLDEAIPNELPVLPNEPLDTCESGYCMT